MSSKNNDFRGARLRRLDERLARLRRLDEGEPPRGGWLRTIRSALGMSAGQLAKRLEITQQSVSHLERREARGAATLMALRKAADALDCTLVYALVPRRPLAEMRERQAFTTARTLTARVAHTMRLEEQGVESSTTGRMTTELADELLRSGSRRIWDTPGPAE